MSDDPHRKSLAEIAQGLVPERHGPTFEGIDDAIRELRGKTRKAVLGEDWEELVEIDEHGNVHPVRTPRRKPTILRDPEGEYAAASYEG